MKNYSFLFSPNCALLTMMKDQFANYVVQKVSFRKKHEKNMKALNILSAI